MNLISKRSPDKMEEACEKQTLRKMALSDELKGRFLSIHEKEQEEIIALKSENSKILQERANLMERIECQNVELKQQRELAEKVGS